MAPALMTRTGHTPIWVTDQLLTDPRQFDILQSGAGSSRSRSARAPPWITVCPLQLIDGDTIM